MKTALWRWTHAVAAEWSWRHTAGAVAAGTFLVLNMGWIGSGTLDFGIARAWVYNVLQFGLPFVFALRMADHAVAGSARPAWAYGAAVLGVAALGVYLGGPLLAPLIIPVFGDVPGWSRVDDFGLLCGCVLTLGLVTLAYAQWRREREALARLRRAELGRARHEQWTQAARLLALQARIEPQFLFDALRRVRVLIGASNAAAEQLLADLIALLRALQPRAGAAASSVEREFGLVHAYARAGEMPSLRPPCLELEAPGEAMRAGFAPLVLLPLLRRLTAEAPQSDWRASATVVDGRLRIDIAPRADLARARAALQALDATAFEQRLAAVHGSDARLAVLTAPALHLEVHYQTDSDDQSPDR